MQLLMIVSEDMVTSDQGNQGVVREFNFCHGNRGKIREFNENLEKIGEFDSFL